MSQHKPTIVATGELPSDGEQLLEQSYSAVRLWKPGEKSKLPKLAEKIEAAVSVAPNPFSRDLINALPHLKLISHFGVGYDSVDIAAASERGIAVTNTPDVLSDAVAELACVHVLMLARGCLAADRFVRSGRWAKGSFPLTRGLKGARVGIVGLGRIGVEIANRLLAFKAEIRYWQRRKRPDVDFVFESGLVELAAWSDYLVIAVPGGANTAGLVNEAVIASVGPEGAIVNISRGSVIDEVALVAALESGRLGGAGLDVFLNEPVTVGPLLESSKTVVSPHMASGTEDTFKAMTDLVLENLAAFYAGNSLLTPVALPEIK